MKISRNFLEKNLFEKPKVDCGFERWFYIEKGKYEIVICPMRGTIYATNYENGDTVDYDNRKCSAYCTTEKLQKILQFLNIKDEFDYE